MKDEVYVSTDIEADGPIPGPHSMLSFASALDIKTFAMAILGTGYRDSTKRNMPKRWFDELRHTHVALDDALGQHDAASNQATSNDASSPTDVAVLGEAGSPIQDCVGIPSGHVPLRNSARRRPACRSAGRHHFGRNGGVGLSRRDCGRRPTLDAGSERGHMGGI